jgi:hypothetical protein
MMALDQALAEIVLPQPDPAVWPEQLAGVARRLREVMRTHDLIPPWTGMPPGGSRTLQFHDGMLAIMRTGGLPGTRSAAGLYMLWLIVNGLLIDEARCDAPEGVTSLPFASQPVSSVPSDRFPNLSAVARELAGSDFDVLFEKLLAILMKGLTA